ncbi:MAG: SPFH domain-containing protein, partial [Bacteroidaceae bacterium]|nr:SPFH domain-containing protein [Bacteroidaceae bacterium]
LDADPIKVNDKTGNPVMIGLVLVWKLSDTYKALFEVDSQTMAASPNTIGSDTKGLMNALENFVRVQSDAALRQVAGQYAYDDEDSKSDEPTLRSSADEINEQLELKLNERLALAGIEVVEARINYLAYAPEIAAVMLRRQQASAIITAREKIVEGAVGMVKMALDKLSGEEIVELDDDKKAAMVSNLLVVLCGDESAQPVVNTGTLNH